MDTAEDSVDRPRALIVRHQEGGNAGELVAWLARGLGESRAHVEVVALGDFGAGDALEPFMKPVGADENVVVVHMLESMPEGAETGSLGVVESVARADRQLCQRFPALEWVDTWAVVDLGRAWTEQSRALAQGLLNVAREVRLKGVIAVTGSTTGSVAGDPEDRDGMMADAVWALAVGRLSSYSGVLNVPHVWAFGSRSFTIDTGAFAALTASDGVVAALGEGILAPIGAAILDQPRSEGASWVDQMGIGSDRERQDLVSTASNLIERLKVDPATVEQYAAVDWGLAIRREYVRLSGAPLMRIKQAIDGNARVRLRGRSGEPNGGLVAAFDGALLRQLQQTSGCLKAGRFLSGVAEQLEVVRKKVTETQHVEPSVFDVDAARATLDRCLERLPSPLSWVGRTLALVTVLVVACSSLPAVWAAGVPLLVGAAMALWGWAKRWRAGTLRRDYMKVVDDRLEAVVAKNVLTAQLDLIRELQRHVGDFLDADGNPVTMEEAVEPERPTRPEPELGPEPDPEPEPVSRAADVFRIWTALRRILDMFSTVGSDLERFSAHPASGRFFSTYPGSDAEARAVADATDAWAVSAKAAAQSAVEEGIETLTLEATAEEIDGLCGAAAIAAVSRAMPGQRLELVGAQTLERAAEELAHDNRPRLGSAVGQREQCLLQAFHGRPSAMAARLDGLGAVAWDASDDRRVSVLWIVEQDFTAPVPAAMPLPPMGPQETPEPVPDGVRVSREAI